MKVDATFLFFLTLFLGILAIFLFLWQPGQTSDNTAESMPAPVKEKRTMTVLGFHKAEHEADECQIKFRVEGSSPDYETARVAFSKMLVNLSEVLVDKRITNRMVTSSKNRIYEQWCDIDQNRGSMPSHLQKPTEKRYIVEQDFEIHLNLAESAPPALVVDALTKQGARILSVKFPFSPEFRRAAENDCFRYAVEDAKEKALALLSTENAGKSEEQTTQIQQLSVQPLKVIVNDREEKGDGIESIQALLRKNTTQTPMNQQFPFSNPFAGHLNRVNPSPEVDIPKLHVLVPNILSVETQVKVVYLVEPKN